MAALLADCICTEPCHACLHEHSTMTADDASLDCCQLSRVTEVLLKAGPFVHNKASQFAGTTLSGCYLQDVYKTAEAVKQLSGDLGGKVVREPGPLPGLKTKITSVEDPDGWKVVFVDNKDFLAEL